MNEDAFNMSLRKFLKQVGVTSQQAVEAFVRDTGKTAGALEAKVTLTIAGTAFSHTVEGRIDLD